VAATKSYCTVAATPSNTLLDYQAANNSSGASMSNLKVASQLLKLASTLIEGASDPSAKLDAFLTKLAKALEATGLSFTNVSLRRDSVNSVMRKTVLLKPYTPKTYKSVVRALGSLGLSPKAPSKREREIAIEHLRQSGQRVDDADEVHGMPVYNAFAGKGFKVVWEIKSTSKVSIGAWLRIELKA